ncbi:epoxide hydrolase family protein [Jidongwangia harbinensis]|uniref:epoxide hydrolase family protein n=1 Tax=Jidongwangia harbinensis TaxID=2878561 RepID=UPI001CD958B2|nr:epoxide hydrolase family protein [Jidongwangia harbinensis]MCA2212007.1 epoxide hydrolase [Jidongwangia harbinensis]
MDVFRVRVPQDDLDDLAGRLARTRWPDELPGAGWDYGIPLPWVRELALRWQTFDWRAHEDQINTFAQYVTTIDGQRVHFLHVRSAHPDALPLLLTHGWPGSVVEFLGVLGPLSAHFHLVVPSIPGFGFSGPTRDRGWDQHRVARAWAELMRRLGYRRYGAQGGDWGAGISRALAAHRPAEVVGVHLTYLPTPGSADGLGAADRARLEHLTRYAANRPGYQILHATRPQTLAYALTDSPVGQLAWIAERFAEWTDPATPVHDDVILANVMHHWLNRTAGPAARLARESTPGMLPCPVPVGVAVLPHDIVRSVRPLAERTYDIRRWTEYRRGGHFAALEVPDEFVADVTAFFTEIGAAAPR